MNKPHWKWLAVFGAATAIDLLVRFGLPFRLNRVLWVEALLFPGVGLVFLLLMRREAAQVGFRRNLQLFLVAAFFLAGLRSGLWAAGVPIGTANITVLVAAFLAWTGFRIKKRRRARQDSAHS